MRPIDKWMVGYQSTKETMVSATYHPYTKANPVLQENIGRFCSYCEVFSTDLEVEHVIAQSLDKTQITNWNNFLLSCGQCNRDKWNKSVDFSQIYLPHLNNTLLALKYGEGGLVEVHATLSTQNQKDKAMMLIDLIGLDKYPGNPKSKIVKANDKRWENRRKTWEFAGIKLTAYKAGYISVESIIEFAKSRGYFSIWFTIFLDHKEVKEALVKNFKGTATGCFDENFNLVPRNLLNSNDPI
jgi:uncharacterized protein (TIGR02646 family)